MTLPLKPTRLEHTYEMGDESGYRFTVVASYDPETGWSASVHMATHGDKTPDAAVEHLRHSAEDFLRQLDAKPEPVKVEVGQQRASKKTGLTYEVTAYGGDIPEAWWVIRLAGGERTQPCSERALLESYELVGGAPDGVNAASVLGVQP